MKFFLLALKRRLRSPSFALMLILLAICVFASAAVGGRVEMSPCALVDEDRSHLSEKLCGELTENNFVICRDRQELYSAVSMGKYDCGIIIREGFSQRVESCDLSEAAVAVTSPVSILTEVYKAHAMGEMYRLAAPGLSYSVIEEQGLDLSYEAVELEFNEYLAGGDRFSFDIKNAHGAELENVYGEKLIYAALALLGFAVMYPAASSAAGETLRRSWSIGDRAAVRAVLIPDLAARLLCCFAAGAIGLVAACSVYRVGEASGALLPFAAYLLTLVPVGMVLSWLLPRNDGFVIPLVLLASLALCPIFTDVGALIPALGKLRWLFPPCWFYYAMERPVVWLIAGAAATIVMILLSPRTHEFMRQRSDGLNKE